MNAIKGELKTERLKNSAVEVGTTILDGIGSMIGTSKVKRQEQEIEALRQEVAFRDESIEVLQKQITTMQSDHSRELITMQARHGKEVADLKGEANKLLKTLVRVDALFPYVKGLLKWESYCKDIGLTKEWIKALFTMQSYRYTGDLYSIRYRQTFYAEDVTLQFKPEKDSPGGFRLTINGKEDSEWFKQQRKEFYERLGLNIESGSTQRVKLH